MQTRTHNIQHTKNTRRHQKTDIRRPETTLADIKKQTKNKQAKILTKVGFRNIKRPHKDKGREVGLYKQQ